MIISKTPYRVSFFGGGTDFPAWYKEYGGAVLSTTIDKYCYISCRNLPPFFPHKHRFVYSVIENVISLDDIKHPSIRNVLQWLDIQDGLEIHHDGDLPARSGLGSSSSFTVGLLNVLRAYASKHYAKHDLAKDAIYLEQKVMNEVVGSQDQIASAYGGFNHIVFEPSNDFTVKPMVMCGHNEVVLNNHMLLFFTGIQRFACAVEREKLQNINVNISSLKHIGQMVDEGISLLSAETVNFVDFGKLLNEGWKLKRSLSSGVSNSEIDEAYEAALAEGAVGGKLLGAGGGGFLLLFAHPDKHASIIHRLKQYVYVPFRFEKLGSSIALYQPTGL